MTRASVTAALVAAGVLAGIPPAWGATKCTLTYSLTGWSAIYATAAGSGTVRCDDGESARVSLRAKGGGLTAGKSRIIGGHGTFSAVSNLNELLGTYAAAEAHAGVVDSSAAQVVTKGTVSLALSGTGKGVDLGVTFGRFVIQKVAPPTKREP